MANDSSIKTVKTLVHVGGAVDPVKEKSSKANFLLVDLIELLNRTMNDIEQRISEHPFFRSMAPAHLGLVTESAKEAKFESNQIIFREKEPADRFYLIESGRVALGWHTPEGKMVLVQTLGPGEVIGWSWLFPPFVWHFQARATEPTCTVVLDGGQLLVAAEENPQFGYDLMRRIAQMVITRLQASRRSRVVVDGAK